MTNYAQIVTITAVLTELAEGWDGDEAGTDTLADSAWASWATVWARQVEHGPALLTHP